MSAKILIIDDEPSIRTVLRDILEMEDYKVEEAKDGIDALSKIKKTKFDAAICDIKMPKMDGMEVLERINILSPDTPVIMISGHGDIDTAVETVKKGAFDYISKPPDLNRLLITIRNALDKSSLVAETKVLKKRIKKTKKHQKMQSDISEKMQKKRRGEKFTILFSCVPFLY